MQNLLPKITIVTPVFNQVDMVEQTIQSVLGQGYPNLEYIVIDGGSTDGTAEIIQKYADQLCYNASEADAGVYDALNKGFDRSSGELMGWINGGDVLMPGSLANLARVFSDIPDLRWLQGLSTYMDKEGCVIRSRVAQQFSLIKFLRGQYQWIQQESTFWRRSLWEDTGARLNDTMKLAGDFELWFRFSQHAVLYNVELVLGAWRITPGQLSEDKKLYDSEVQGVLKAFSVSHEISKRLSKVERYDRLIAVFRWLKFPVPRRWRRRYELHTGENKKGVYYVADRGVFVIKRHYPGYYE